MVDEPRSLRLMRDGWMTDSRSYNLLWLGRWLERAESVMRGMDTAARRAQREPDAAAALTDCLCDLASSLGVHVADRRAVAADLLLRDAASSVLQCVVKARLAATQVAPVELLRALTEAALALEGVDAAELETPERVIELATAVVGLIVAAGSVIEDEWFGRESLSDEEIYRRFAQQ